MRPIKLWAITTLFVISISGSPVRAEERVTCLDVIKACDIALEKKEKEIELKDLALKQSQDHLSRTLGDLENAREQLGSPFRNPFIMVTVGVVLGIVVTGVALK